jgi:hypothetical protein
VLDVAVLDVGAMVMRRTLRPVLIAAVVLSALSVGQAAAQGYPPPPPPEQPPGQVLGEIEERPDAVLPAVVDRPRALPVAGSEGVPALVRAGLVLLAAGGIAVMIARSRYVARVLDA